MIYNNEKIKTFEELSQGLSKGEFSAVELNQAYLNEVELKDSTIKAFLSVKKDKILSDAAEADQRRKSGNELSKYDGIPVGIKDCIVAQGENCSCASKILEPVVAPYDSTAVARLRAKGFIPFGRLNMDEFAMGSSCENSAFQKTTNPHDSSRVPGGSSGGSAASVAANLVPASLGSDTGGSIRQPASFCGVVGLKPTYGRISRYGLVAFASSLDQIGPFSNSVADASVLLDVMSGKDHRDSTSLPLSATNTYSVINNLNGSLKGKKIGLPKEYFECDGIAKGVSEVVQGAIDKMRSLGAEIVEVNLPHTRYAVAVYYVIATAEASANLARFDGIRYGARVKCDDLLESYFQSRGAGFGDEVKRRILLGTYVLSSGYYDAYYLRAQKVRTLIRQDFEAAYKKCDLLLTPVTPDVAFKFGEKSDPLQMYLSDIFTIALNLSGACGISIPAGFDKTTNMPVGIQLLGPSLGEDTLLQVANVFERAK